MTKLVIGSQLATICGVASIISTGETPYGFTPLVYSPSRGGKRVPRAFSRVVATCVFFWIGYHLFSQVKTFTPHAKGIYSPSLATRVVATFRLPTGYHPKARTSWVSPDVATRADTTWTRANDSEKWELLSGNKSQGTFPQLSTVVLRQQARCRGVIFKPV